MAGRGGRRGRSGRSGRCVDECKVPHLAGHDRDSAGTDVQLVEGRVRCTADGRSRPTAVVKGDQGGTGRARNGQPEGRRRDAGRAGRGGLACTRGVT